MEQTLIKKAKSGDEHAFRVLVETYHTFVFHSVYAVLRNEKDAEDATQEVFLKIYLSLPQYQNQGFKTWVSRIAVNHAIDMRRKAYRQREVTTEDNYLDISESTVIQCKGNGIDEQIVKREMKQLLHERIEQLPKNYRKVVYGFYIEEKTYEQLAKERGLKRDTIATQLYRARQWMKKHWKESDFL